MRSVRAVFAEAVRPFNRPRVYTARYGPGRGFKQVGGIGLVLPRFPLARGEAALASREESLLRSLQLDGNTVFDIGAFEGVMTLFFSGQVGSRGRVVAFEPRREAFDRIRYHVRLNGLTNVTVRNMALGKHSGTLTMAYTPEVPARTSGNPSIQRTLIADRDEVETLSVPINSLDNELASSSLPDPDLVKIDVEGMELDVLEGMRETIQRCRPRLFVEMHGESPEARRANAGRVVGVLTEHGYVIRHVETAQAVDSSTPEIAATGHLYCIWESER